MRLIPVDLIAGLAPVEMSKVRTASPSSVLPELGLAIGTGSAENALFIFQPQPTQIIFIRFARLNRPLSMPRFSPCLHLNVPQ
jgi:hypothetical protein